MFVQAAKLKYSLQKMFRAAAHGAKFSWESKWGYTKNVKQKRPQAPAALLAGPVAFLSQKSSV
jgi:hypothetical protein